MSDARILLLDEEITLGKPSADTSAKVLMDLVAMTSPRRQARRLQWPLLGEVRAGQGT